MKAYHVQGDVAAAIVFATNSATARREGGREIDLEFEEVESCRRAPEFDQYAPGPVPVEALLAAGWWHECGHCYACVTDSTEGRIYERWDVFCSAKCCEADRAASVGQSMEGKED